MIKWLLSFLTSFFIRKSSEKKIKYPKQYSSQLVALPYLLGALFYFGVQGLVATLGAMDLVFPDIPAPIKFQVGRAIHLKLSIYWPLLGIMGIVYYFFIREAETELYSTGLAWIQFGLFIITSLAAYTSLIFGVMRGTEYQETFWLVDIGLALVLFIFAHNLTRTYFKSKVPRQRVTLLAMLFGALSLVFLYIPNIFEYVHPTTNEIIRFWVVHLWEEMSKEVLLMGVLVAFLITINEGNRKVLEKPLLLQISLLILSATLATGHHYYWIGVPFIWLWIGGVFSVLQTVAIFLMGYIVYLGLQKVTWQDLSGGAKLAFGFTLSSIFHHLTGAGLMGLAIAIPQLNKYSHGTYLTSSHAHLALFGAVGMLVLAGSTYILSNYTRIYQAGNKTGLVGFNNN